MGVIMALASTVCFPETLATLTRQSRLVRSTAVLYVRRGSERKGPIKYQSQRRRKGGVAVQKRTSATWLCEKEILTFGRDDFLLLVLSLNNNKQGVLRQSMRKYMSQGGLRGKAGRGV